MYVYLFWGLLAINVVVGVALWLGCRWLDREERRLEGDRTGQTGF